MRTHRHMQALRPTPRPKLALISVNIAPNWAMALNAKRICRAEG
eukprot:CAMPEP_0171154648 /NCGR_PEP_ID=MMETSP0790-20130122/444_1 /TAXON_ID=2925 /ORGANISM="Alexandrium catenella, Strain OF101" /LENGTH=43 /DNA_ID= /DNA_START= /DNA_END= /DNA_ORIENTATION=